MSDTPEFKVIPFTEETIPPLFREFVKFCEEQPEEKHINHSEGWDTCTVGDFTRHKVRSFLPNSEILGCGDNNLFAFVGGMSMWNWPQPSDTYGEFSKEIKRWLPEEVLND